MATGVVNFLGFRQVSKGYFDALSAAEKKNYMWFVREIESGETKHAEIYFGTRKYGELNDDEQESIKLNNLLTAMGSMVDDDGNWVGFPELSVSGNTLADFLENIVEHFEEEIAEQEHGVEEALSAETAERQAADEELIEAINQESELRAESDEALSGMIHEVDVKVDNLEEKVQELINLGVLHFAGTASAISGDTIILFDGTEIEPSSANTGDVWIIGKAEYASNGEEWIELGDDEALAKLIADLAAEKASRQAEDAALNDKIGGLDARVDALESDTTHLIMGDDVEEYDEGELDVIVNSQIANVATNGGTALIQNDATLDNTVVVAGE